MSPRAFERPATIGLPETPSLPPGSSLEGLWLPPRAEEGARGGAVIAPPHPMMGGSMDSPVTTEVALAASDVGYAALRFNYRGVGGSAGTPSGEAEDSEFDYRAALEFVQESVEGGILACGYSWGALAAARIGVSSPRVRKLVLIAPPPAMLDRAALTVWGRPILVIAGDRDDFVPIDELTETLASIEDAELVVVEGVDHFFMAGLAEIGRNARRWLGD